MINSFCIKTNHNFILDYLLNQLEQTDLDGIYLSKNKFKNYKNIIVHSCLCSYDDFVFHVASSLANTVLAVCEPYIIRKLICLNYFYFSEIEKKEILDSAKALLNTSPKDVLKRRRNVFLSFEKYLKENRTLILDGFILFRLKDYQAELDETIDLAVDKFILEKEYNEFISLLKLYVASKEPGSDALHLIYKHQESILLNSNLQKINTYDHIFDAKYLSDISFSSNDYALNTILNIVPQKLYIHLVESTEDEFITTLKLILEDRISICKGCSICEVYSSISNNTASPFMKK